MGRSSRFGPTEFQFRRTPSQAEKRAIANRNAPSTAGHDGIADEFKRAAQFINGIVYLHWASTQDKIDLRQLAAQIDAGLRSSNGVAIARITIQNRDGAGNTIPQYVGLQVVGFGDDLLAAQEAAKEKTGIEQECVEIGDRKYCAPKSVRISTMGVCTPENPTGTLPRKEAAITPLPEGYNFGYASMMASKLNPVMQNNPGNKNDSGSLVFHQAYVERELFFISKHEWEKMKASWKGSN